MPPAFLRTRGRGARGLALELGVVAVGLGCNLVVRQYTVDDLDRAVEHARDIVALEQLLHVDWEHSIQNGALTVPWLAEVSSWFYVWGYFPVVLATLIWLYVRRPTSYALLRNALLASGAVGLLCYAFYPAAPPRLSGMGYTDTVVGSGSLDAAARPVGVANELAAIPSFHIAWLVVVAAVVLTVTRSSLMRTLAVLVPVTMSYVIVATGNHWVLDVPAGVALAVVGLGVARALTHDRSAPARRAEFDQRMSTALPAVSAAVRSAPSAPSARSTSGVGAATTHILQGAKKRRVGTRPLSHRPGRARRSSPERFGVRRPRR